MNKWGSRKFLMALVGAVVVIVNALLEANGKKPLDSDTVMAFASLIISYIAVEGFVDARK